MTRLVDLTVPLQKDSAVRIVTPDSPEALALYRHSTAHLMAAAVTKLFPGAQCGIGPATDEGFFYDFVVDRPFVPEDLEAIEKKMKELAAAGPALRAADVAARRSDAVLLAERGTAQGAADRREDRGTVRSLVLHHQGSRHVRGLLRRSARAVLRPAQGVQAADHLERVLEGRCEEPADAAHLRHRVPERRGAQSAPAAPRGSEKTRPSQAREGPRPVHVSPVGAGRDVLAREGDDALEHRWPTTCAAC